MIRSGINKRYGAALLMALIFTSSCNVVKYLKPGQQLYTGAEVKVTSGENLNLKPVAGELEKALTPKPNKVLFGARIKLWFYYMAGENPKKGFRKMLKNKLGEPPVLFDPAIPGHVTDILASRLHNMGYFNGMVRYDVQHDEKKTSISYTAVVSEPYTVAEMIWPEPGTELAGAVKSTAARSLISKGKRYDLDLLKNERTRIDGELKEQGYYFFNPDHLLFLADSTNGSKTIKLRLQVKENVSYKTRRPYRINDIYIYTSRRLGDTLKYRRNIDTAEVDGFYYIYRNDLFRPEAITRAVVLQKGKKYSRKAHSATLSRLMSMGMFHYANIRFADTIRGDTGLLDAHIYLTPMRKRTIRAELQAVTKSNNYTGPALNLSYRNRNLFRGAELLVLNFNTNYEMQFTGLQKGFNSYEVGGNAQLFFPKFVVPFRLRNVSSTHIPRTKFELGFRNLHRMQYFNMNAANFSYGFNWKESARKEHQLDPFAVNFAKVLNSTQAFQDVLRTNPFLRRTFEEQFTIGGYYSFTYNGLVNNVRSNQYYFNSSIDLSGNLLNLLHQSLYGRQPTIRDPFRLFNFRYAQYSKVTADIRHYHVFDANSKIASRVIAGVGVPYGNSQSLPYIKQFFSGGSNSIRAFLPRTLGPGTYASPDSALRRGFLDQAGDVKFEANLEYRFTIIDFLKGAVFVDAGNVWLFRQNDQLPGGRFDVSRFYRQLAVGTGFGLRLDITYFVLRFDLGMPLRKPYVAANRGWVHGDIAFGSKSWRRQNVVLNIAIGYPF